MGFFDSGQQVFRVAWAEDKPEVQRAIYERQNGNWHYFHDPISGNAWCENGNPNWSRTPLEAVLTSMSETLFSIGIDPSIYKPYDNVLDDDEGESRYEHIEREASRLRRLLNLAQKYAKRVPLMQEHAKLVEAHDLLRRLQKVLYDFE